MSKFGKRKVRKIDKKELYKILGKTFIDKEQAIKQIEEMNRRKK